VKPGLTATLAGFIARAHRLEPDSEVCRIVSNGFVDTAGVMLAGSREPVVEALLRHLAEHGRASGEANLLFGSQRASARDAALINATAAHALDYDDVALCGHPSVVLVPALLAEGQRLKADGKSLINAYLAGYETWAELNRRDDATHHLKGWHPTGVFGVVAVAAAVASLRRLPPQLCVNVLAIAASMASGVVANFGSMVKPLHAGLAAAHAIDAVNLACSGIEGAGDAIEHHAGYLAALSPNRKADLSSPADSLGVDLKIRKYGLNIKKYPMCFATHRIIDGALDIATRHDVNPQNIKCLHAHIGVAQASMLRNHRPETAVQGKFSIEFALAAAFIARKVGLKEVDDTFIARADVRSLFEKVSITTRTTVCEDEPALAASDRLIVELNDGSRLDSGEIEFALGSARKPITPDALRQKFMDCAAVAPDAHALTIYRCLSDLEAQSQLADFALPVSTNVRPVVEILS